jgi:hypothetical protein
MRYRIKRHFILAGEAARNGPGIVKNCEERCELAPPDGSGAKAI